MAERVVVLGSNSFSGATFVDYCLGEGLEVVGMSRSNEPSDAFLPYKWRPHDKAYQFFRFDINKDLDQIMSVIRDFRPDYVVNFAAQSMVAESWLHPEHWYQTNIVSAVKLHEQLRKCEFLRKYVHVSTPEVYGSTEGVVKEGFPYNPSTPYAVSKASIDMSLSAYFKAYKFPVVFTRAANVYGPGQHLYKIIPRAAVFFLLGKQIELHGGGHSIRSFIHMRDVSSGTLMVARHGNSGEVYHLSTDEFVSIRELVDRIVSKLGVSAESLVKVVGDRLGKDKFYKLDSSKIRELGWRDTVALDQGIDETLDWAKKNISVLKDQPFSYAHKE